MEELIRYGVPAPEDEDENTSGLPVADDGKD